MSSISLIDKPKLHALAKISDELVVHGALMCVSCDEASLAPPDITLALAGAVAASIVTLRGSTRKTAEMLENKTIEEADAMTVATAHAAIGTIIKSCAINGITIDMEKFK